MHPQQPPLWQSPALPTRRIVALVMIALLTAALAFHGLTRGEERPSVPRGARAGDLTLSSCTYPTEDGDLAADCGLLSVPENRGNPDSRLIALPVTRIRAASATPGEPVFWLQGGPGKSNMTFPQASRLAGERDVVLIGYRGADGSVRLDCPEVTGAMRHASDVLSDDAHAAKAQAFNACATRLQRDGVDLAGYTIPQRVDDLEAARLALGYGRINLISESAGTRYALVYSWRYPASIARSVMIGANPPGHFLYGARTTDELIERYAALCAQSDSCRDRTDDLVASLRRTAADLPERWHFLPVHAGNVRTGTFFGMVHATSAAAPLSGPMTLDAWLSAAEGDASGLWLFSLMAGVVLPEGMIWGDSAAMGMQDAATARALYATAGSRDGIIGTPATDFLWAGGRLVDAWPHYPEHDLYGQMQRSDVETLVISGTLDFATPPQVATAELMPFLPNGKQVLLANLGHTDDFWTHQPAASRRLLQSFFRDGSVDQSLYTPATVDFDPGMTDSMLANIVLGAMVATVAMSLVALLVMALHLWWRGAFGIVSSSVLRTILPLLLGFGGWFAGALLVLIIWPTAYLLGAGLVAVTTGLPAGVGIALAWLDPAGRRSPRATGVLLALCSALAGAWLGGHAAGGAPAVLTATAGAAAAANLALIALDAVFAGAAPAAAGAESREPALARA